MFFKTTIQATRAGYAFDTSGRRLSFIGNLPCQAGDTVWTDGKVIFGHIANKPQPITFDEQSGIPAIFSQGRGYFNSSGNFKKFPVVDDSWILNDDKFFKHNTNSLLDAEFSNNGELFTAEFVNFISYSYGLEPVYRTVIQSNVIIQDAVIHIKKDGVLLQEVLGSQLAESLKPNATAVLNTFEDESNNTVTFEDVFSIDLAINSLKLDRDGNWTAFCSANIFVQRTFERQIQTIVYKVNHDDTEFIVPVPEDTAYFDELVSKTADNIRNSGLNYELATGGEPLESWVAHSNISTTLNNFFHRQYDIVYLDIWQYIYTLEIAPYVEPLNMEDNVEKYVNYRIWDVVQDGLSTIKSDRRQRVRFLLRAAFHSSDLNSPEIVFRKCIDFHDVDFSDRRCFLDYAPPSINPDVSFSEHAIKTGISWDVKSIMRLALIIADKQVIENFDDTPFYYQFTNYHSNIKAKIDNDYKDFNAEFFIPAQDNFFLSAIGSDELLNAPRVSEELQNIFVEGKETDSTLIRLFNADSIPVADMSNSGIRPLCVFPVVKINDSHFLLAAKAFPTQGVPLSLSADLFRIKNGNIEKIGNTLRNFRLRKINNLSNTRR